MKTIKLSGLVVLFGVVFCNKSDAVREGTGKFFGEGSGHRICTTNNGNNTLKRMEGGHTCFTEGAGNFQSEGNGNFQTAKVFTRHNNCLLG